MAAGRTTTQSRNPEQKFWIRQLSVIQLWGVRNVELHFHSDVNILIGPNASGKTTILNLLHYTLGGDLRRLADIQFSRIDLTLQGFQSRQERKVSVQRDGNQLRVQVGREAVVVNLDLLTQFEILGGGVGTNPLPPLIATLKSLVPAVWLPVTRRLPVPEEAADITVRWNPHPQKRMESVDERLAELAKQLVRYRLQLDARMATRYKKFERRVLELILYNKSYDTWAAVGPPAEEEKQQLVRAFQEAGLLDRSITRRIDEHFKAANEAVNRIATDRQNVQIEDLFVVPLIRRTKSMVDFARELEVDRDELFAPLRKFESLVNSFLEQKRVSVSDSGQMSIRSVTQPVRDLTLEHLSSGEKQILILLIQALLREDSPVVYVADEPELSLHVTWQEKLLPALVDLGRQIQIIVATHSPDIVGPYRDKVIALRSKG